MQESGKIGLGLKKSYEISYALWRVAANIGEKTLADAISEKAIELLALAADENYGIILGKIAGIEILIRFSIDVAAISLNNGDILLKELQNLKAAMIQETGKSEIGKRDPYIADIFESKVSQNQDFQEAADMPIENGSPKAEIRQSAILERIRQIGNCRLNDIQQVLPDCSERTIRYDLEALVQKNLIERVGTGGRSVYYKIRG